MTIDDDSSIYVGGLSYDVSEDSLRRVFDIYGAVIAVKINNDRATGGNCYGFVTFANPRSAAQAIREMDGQTIYGRVVKVNEVRRRGRPNFNRENSRRDFDREIEDDGRRGQRRDFSYDRQRHRDIHRERFQDYEKESERGHYRRYVDEDQFMGDYGHRGDVEHGRFRKLERDWERDSSFNSVEPRNTSRQKSLDRNNHHQMKDHRYVDGDQFDNGDAEQGRVRKREHDWERESSFNSAEPRNNSRQNSVDRNNHHQMKDHRYVDGDQFDNGPKGDVEQGRGRKRERDWESGSSFNSAEPRNNSRQKSVDRDNQPLNRSTFSDDRSRGPSVESLNNDQDQIEVKSAASDQKIEKLREEISRMEDYAADKEEEVSQLREKYQKLDDSLKAATKLTSHRHMQLEKLYKCYLQVKDYEKKFKKAEDELQLLVDATRMELEMEGV